MSKEQLKAGVILQDRNGQQYTIISIIRESLIKMTAVYRKESYTVYATDCQIGSLSDKHNHFDFVDTKTKTNKFQKLEGRVYE